MVAYIDVALFYFGKLYSLKTEIQLSSPCYVIGMVLGAEGLIMN